MKALTRVVLWVAGAVLALAVVAAIALKLFIDPNDYRDDIATAVEDATGRSLTIEGDLSLQVFPVLGVRLGPVELSNPPGFEEQRFLRVENAAVSVRLLPLIFRQELAVGVVELKGLDLGLIALENGRTNFGMGGPAAESGAGKADNDAPAEPPADAGPGLQGLDVAGIDISGRIAYRDEATGEAIEVTNLELSAGSIVDGKPFALEAKLNVSGLAPDTDVRLDLLSDATLDLAAQTVALSGTDMKLAVTSPEVPGGSADIDLSLADVRDLGGETFSFAGLAMQLRVAGISLSVNGNGAVTDSIPAIDGDLSVAPFSPRDLLQALGEPPMETADPAVLNNLAVDAAFNVQGDTAELNLFNVVLDDTTGAGQFSLSSIENMSMELDLQFDALDLDRYTAPTPENAGGQGGGGGGGANDALDLPVEDLRALDVSGRIGFDELSVADITLKKLNMRIRAQEGVIRLAPIRANLYGGRYTDKISLDVTGDVPKVALKSDLQRVRIGRFLADTQDFRNIEGTADVSLDVRTTGLTESDMLENVKGMVSVNMEDGRYKGTDLWYELRAAKARIKDDELPAPPKNPSTDISKFSGSARIADGVVKNRDFLALIPFIQLEGAGDINYLDSTLDYELEAQITGEKTFNDGYSMEDLDGVAVPVRLRGDIEQPRITIDMNTVLQSLAERKAKDRLLEKLGAEEPSGKKNKKKKKGDKKSSKERKDELKEELRNLFD